MSSYKRLDSTGVSTLSNNVFIKSKSALESVQNVSPEVLGESEESVSSKNYASGDYFVKNDILCKAKTNILIGDPLVLNTNYEETTVSNELTNIINEINLL